MTERGLPTIAPAPVVTDPEIVTFLEGLLAEARAGEVFGIALVAERTGKQFSTHHIGSAGGSMVPFLAFTRILQMEMEDEIRAHNREPLPPQVP